MKNRAIRFLQGAIKVVQRGYRWFRTEAYHPEQEVRVSFDEIEVSKEARDWAASYSLDADIPFMFRPFTFALLGCLEWMLLDMIHSDLTPQQLQSQAMIVTMLPLVWLLFHFVIQERSKRGLARLLELTWDHPRLVVARQTHRNFYVDFGAFVFSNHKPPRLLCQMPRLRTTLKWQELRRSPLLTPFLYYGSLAYLRFAWPYFFNPVQLAFLEYDRAARRLELKAGERVLVIGAGSVPHHIRWKKWLGASGSIVALDIDPWVFRDSSRIERLIEWGRGLFGKGRRLTKYVVGDADEIPLSDESFDVVIAVRCYFVNVKEALRVLKSGGRLCVSTCGTITNEEETRSAQSETSTGFVLVR